MLYPSKQSLCLLIQADSAHYSPFDFCNRGNSIMKSRHRKNKSLVNEHSKSNTYTHHRSFSFNRYVQKNSINIHNHCNQNQNTPADSTSIPMSTEFNREIKLKKIQVKQNSQQLNKEKKGPGSKDKEANPRKNKEKNKINRDKGSNQRGDKSNRKGSNEMLRNKPSTQKTKMEHSGQRRYKVSGQKNTVSSNRTKPDKPKGQKPKSNTKRRGNHHEQFASNWEEVVKQYGQCLSQEEINEIREYKWIYFLGKIKNRKVSRSDQCKTIKPLSARSGYAENMEKNGYIEEVSDNNEISEMTSRKYEEELESEDNQFYKYQIGDHIAYRYEIVESINKGSFGEVVKVFDHKSKEHLALKIVKKSQDIVQQTYTEVTILTQIKEKDKSDVNGIVRIKDFTIFRNHICIVFQLLEGNLYQLLESTNYNGLRDQVIRIFAFQILNSLSFLHQEKIIHCDIKPENIVMTSWGKSRVKLIDFGSSCYAGKQMFEYLQSRYYRAPQVMLRQPYSYEIDMWSFGCLLVELKIGEPVFAGSTNTEQLMYIANSIGKPVASDGKYSKIFLQSQQFKEIIEQQYIQDYKYMCANNIDKSEHPFFAECKYIKNCMKTIRQRLEASANYSKEDQTFIRFIEKILVWQPQKRLKPQQALQDSWILRGLPTQIKQFYTIFNSAEYQKKSKPKPKQSKQSKNKASSKRSSNDKPKKQPSGQRKNVNELRSKQYSTENRFMFNNKAINGHVIQK